VSPEVAGSWSALTPPSGLSHKTSSIRPRSRQIAGGEVAGLFRCHGQVVSDDLLEEYAARHFPPVHAAIKTMAGKLAGMFAKVADPFPEDGRKSNPSDRWLEDGKFRRYDVIQSAWSRLKEHTGIKKAFKLLRKTSATKLAEHPSYKCYVEYFLGHSPHSVADKHYRRPSDKEFFEACASSLLKKPLAW
jgi:hypothetical protein